MEMFEFPIKIGGEYIYSFGQLNEMPEKTNDKWLFYMAECYALGIGTKKKSLMASHYYILSAIQGNADAFFRLGELYQYGHSVKKNDMLACKMFQASFALGNMDALVSYAMILLDENSIVYNQSAGYVMLRYAQKMGSEDADYYIEEYYPESIRFLGNLDISETDKIEWYTTAMKELVDDVVSDIECQLVVTGTLPDGSEFSNFAKIFCEVCQKEGALSDDKCQSSKLTSGSKIQKANQAAGIGAGMNLGIVSNASTLYGFPKFNARQGHGYAAERANHVIDLLHGKKSIILGDDNLKWGADRAVDGVNIQSKYCKSGAQCVDSCFENNTYVYKNRDGSPMKLEVPFGMRKDAVAAMKRRIERHEVENVTDPNEAENIIIEGNVTYEQAYRIAKAGNVDSLLFDARNGAIVATGVFSVTTLISFAVNIWNGDDYNNAIFEAAKAGLKTAGSTFVISIVSAQVARAMSGTSIEKIAQTGTEALFRTLGPRASEIYVKAMKGGINIYGAKSMKQASRMFRNELLMGTVTIAIMSVPDALELFRGRISGKQFMKNTAITTSTIVAGSAGRTIGSAVGSFLPVPFGRTIGRKVGGLLGAAIASAVACEVSTGVLNELIEDDSVEMLSIIEGVFQELMDEFLFTKEEGGIIADELNDILTSSLLKDMYASKNRKKFAEDILAPICQEVASNRQRILIPDVEDIVWATRQLLESVANEYSIVY